MYIYIWIYPEKRQQIIEELRLTLYISRMEYQIIVNLLDNTSDQPSKFRTKNWIGINDESRQWYNVDSETRFKTTMSKSRSCDYRDAYILVKGTITIAGDTGPGPNLDALRTAA